MELKSSTAQLSLAGLATVLTPVALAGLPTVPVQLVSLAGLSTVPVQPVSLAGLATVLALVALAGLSTVPVSLAGLSTVPVSSLAGLSTLPVALAAGLPTMPVRPVSLAELLSTVPLAGLLTILVPLAGRELSTIPLAELSVPVRMSLPRVPTATIWCLSRLCPASLAASSRVPLSSSPHPRSIAGPLSTVPVPLGTTTNLHGDKGRRMQDIRRSEITPDETKSVSDKPERQFF